MKAQIAAEFVLFSILALVLCLSILVFMQNYYDNKKSEQGHYEATLLGRQIQKELIVASEVKPGFSRNIKIPEEILGENYTISNSQYQIVIIFDERAQYFNTPKLSGSLKKGDNNILTNETTILIN